MGGRGGAQEPQPRPCPLHARSASRRGYLTVTSGQPDTRSELRLSSSRQRRSRPPKQLIMPPLHFRSLVIAQGRMKSWSTPRMPLATIAARSPGSVPSTSPARDLSKWRSPSAAAGRACGRTARPSTRGTRSSVTGWLSTGHRARWDGAQRDGSGPRSRETSLRTSSGLSGKQNRTLTLTIRPCFPSTENGPSVTRRLGARAWPTRPRAPAWQKIRPTSMRPGRDRTVAHAAAPLPMLGRGCCLRSGSACHRTTWTELTATVTATQRPPATGSDRRRRITPARSAATGGMSGLKNGRSAVSTTTHARANEADSTARKYSNVP